MRRWLPQALVLFALAVGAGALWQWARDGEESALTPTRPAHQSAANEKLPVPEARTAVASPSGAQAPSPEATKHAVIPPDPQRALETEARSGSRSAQSQLCSQAVSHDGAGATIWCEAAARGGDANSQFLYAGLLDVGKGVPLDHTQATHWYEKAAGQDHPQALYVLAKRYLSEDRDVSRSISLLRRAAARGHPGAVAKLRELGESRGDTFVTPGR